MKTVKKVIACVLCVLMAFSCVAVAASAEDFKPLPTIYIKGAAGALVEKARDIKSKEIYPISIPDGYIGDACKELAVPLGRAMLTDDWAEYGAGLYDAVMPIVGKFPLDKNGEASDGSGSKFTSSSKEGRMYHGVGTPIDMPVWNFEYDWRLDPITCADELNAYINTVKSKTKADKVNIIARCLGANVVLARFDKYGAEDINDCILVCADFNGFDAIEAVFTGNIKLDSASVDRFSSCYLGTDTYANDPTFETVRYIVTCLDYIKVLGFSADVLQSVVDGIKDGALAKIIRESVGTMPSFWSYIGDGSYAKAMKYVFGGYEEEYAGVIEKADAFHKILVRWDDILDGAEEDGARFYNVCKYGFQMIPVTGADNRMTDSIVTTETSSFGATCSTLTGKLSASYLLEADAKYVSPDKQVDASTCRYPDHTWFIKNISHRNMPSCLDELFAAIINHDGYTTVFDLEEFPQYIVASDDNTSIAPLTKENGATEEKMNSDATSAAIKLLVKLIIFLLGKLMELINK